MVSRKNREGRISLSWRPREEESEVEQEAWNLTQGMQPVLSLVVSKSLLGDCFALSSPCFDTDADELLGRGVYSGAMARSK